MRKFGRSFLAVLFLGLISTSAFAAPEIRFSSDFTKATLLEGDGGQVITPLVFGPEPPPEERLRVIEQAFARYYREHATISTDLAGALDYLASLPKITSWLGNLIHQTWVLFDVIPDEATKERLAREFVSKNAPGEEYMTFTADFMTPARRGIYATIANLADLPIDLRLAAVDRLLGARRRMIAVGSRMDEFVKFAAPDGEPREMYERMVLGAMSETLIKPETAREFLEGKELPVADVHRLVATIRLYSSIEKILSKTIVRYVESRLHTGNPEMVFDGTEWRNVGEADFGKVISGEISETDAASLLRDFGLLDPTETFATLEAGTRQNDFRFIRGQVLREILKCPYWNEAEIYRKRTAAAFEALKVETNPSVLAAAYDGASDNNVGKPERTVDVMTVVMANQDVSAVQKRQFINKALRLSIQSRDIGVLAFVGGLNETAQKDFLKLLEGSTGVEKLRFLFDEVEADYSTQMSAFLGITEDRARIRNGVDRLDMLVHPEREVQTIGMSSVKIIEGVPDPENSGRDHLTSLRRVAARQPDVRDLKGPGNVTDETGTSEDAIRKNLGKKGREDLRKGLKF